jgi:outer membrane cobalamin receptor
VNNGILFLTALTLAYTGFSEENPLDSSTDTVQIEQLDKMVITATRTARKASEIPVSVTVISLDEIKASAARSIVT